MLVFYETKLEGEDTHFPSQLATTVPHWNILCQFNELPTGVTQPQVEDMNMFRGAVVITNGTGATPEGRAQHAAVLDSQDLSWRKNEIGGKCVILVDNCFVMHFSDSDDQSPVAQTATENVVSVFSASQCGDPFHDQSWQGRRQMDS